MSRTINRYERIPSAPKISVTKEESSKKEEIITSSTKTTITKTTVINKQKTYRVGLIFSENGELLNSNIDLRQLLQKEHQKCLLNGDSDSVTSDKSNSEMNNNSSDSQFNSNIIFEKQTSVLDDANFEYIDDSTDIYNRNYHANTTNSTPRIQRRCVNCKNKINLAKNFSSPALDRKVNFQCLFYLPLYLTQFVL